MDDAFARVLHTWSETYRHALATGDDFCALASRVAGRDLDELFGAWLDRPQLPPLPAPRAASA